MFTDIHEIDIKSKVPLHILSTETSIINFVDDPPIPGRILHKGNKSVTCAFSKTLLKDLFSSLSEQSKATNSEVFGIQDDYFKQFLKIEVRIPYYLACAIKDSESYDICFNSLYVGHVHYVNKSSIFVVSDEMYLLYDNDRFYKYDGNFNHVQYIQLINDPRFYSLIERLSMASGTIADGLQHVV
eukprot:TRINITY_DN9140_c0_g1_i1.p1 TRINITY_DN9140_c0_g1~~TRINITY_DN9140_c0_g1_i1.p1  ORF type:complete len:185 (+),score=15.48 TRINITY_DN9140_c0_g1_i1:113-667(+)